jgi:pseudouridine synthase
VFPIGRLDTDAEGILLLTNDGELAQRLNKPKYEVPKVFLVKIDGHLDEKKIKRLQFGIKIEDFKTRPIQVEKIKETAGKQWLKVTVTDTQNRIIRKVFENVGRPVDKVMRESFGPISTEGMVRGQYRYLSPQEVSKLRNFVGMSDEKKAKK